MALDRILFRAGATLRVVKGKGAPIPQKNLLAITIKEIRVDPRTFLFGKWRILLDPPFVFCGTTKSLNYDAR